MLERFKQADVTVSKRGYQWYALSMVYRDQFVHRQYQGYTLREARALFKEYVLEQDAQIIRNVSAR